jgi:hypothetical protein
VPAERGRQTPTPSAAPTPPPASGGGPATGSDPGGDAAGPAPEGRANGLAVARADPAGPDAVDLSLGSLVAIDGLGIWAVPGAVISGPGFLVIGWVLAQTGAAAMWVPAVRRLRGGDEGMPRAAAA